MMEFFKKRALMLMVPLCCLCIAFILVACSSSTTSTTAAPATTASKTMPAPRAAIGGPWSMDADCASCHTAEAATLTNNKTLLSKHADQNCTSCHTQEVELATVHQNSATDTSKLKRLRRTTVASESCVECHGSWEDLAALTKDSTVIKDAEGTVVNPHTVVSPEINKSKQHNRVTCTSCHQVHTDADLATTANGMCMTCHHAQVYTCGTCHE